MGDEPKTCCSAQRNKQRAAESAGRAPGRPMTSGFDWHDADCPTIPGRMTRERQARLQAYMDEWNACQRRALAHAKTAVIG